VEDDNDLSFGTSKSSWGADVVGEEVFSAKAPETESAQAFSNATYSGRDWIPRRISTASVCPEQYV
jgi:hypothetical protein